MEFMNIFWVFTSLIYRPAGISSEWQYSYTSQCVRAACADLISHTYIPSVPVNSKECYIEILVKLFTDKPLTLPEIDTLVIFLHNRASETGFDKWIHEQIDRPTVLSTFIRSFPKPYNHDNIRDAILQSIRTKVIESESFHSLLYNLTENLPPNSSKRWFCSKNFTITPFGVFLKNEGNHILVYSPRIIIKWLSSRESEFKEKMETLGGVDIYSMEFSYSANPPITIIVDKEWHNITWVDSAWGRYKIKAVLHGNKVMATLIANHQLWFLDRKKIPVPRPSQYNVVSCKDWVLTLQNNTSPESLLQELHSLPAWSK